MVADLPRKGTVSSSCALGGLNFSSKSPSWKLEERLMCKVSISNQSMKKWIDSLLEPSFLVVKLENFSI